MNKKPIGSTIARLASGLLAFGLALPLHAGVGGSAFVDITNFTLTGSGLTLLESPTTDADVDASLTGFPSIATTGSSSTTSLNLATGCLGANCAAIGSNLFPLISGTPTATRAAADQVSSGSVTAGARFAVGSYASVASGNSAASADSNMNLLGAFTVNAVGPVTLHFDARAYMEAFVSASEGIPSVADGNYQLVFSILDLSSGGATVFSWSPNGGPGGIFGGAEIADGFNLNTNASLNAPVAADTLNPAVHTPGVQSTGAFTATTGNLQPGSIYQFSMRLVSAANATRVPALSALGDRVWKDTNTNGIQDCTDTNGNGILGDAGDTGPECASAGVPNVPVYLTLCDGTPVANMVTDGNGFYLFPGLDPAQQYKVRFDISGTGLNFTQQNVGANDAADSDADVNTGETQCITLTPNATDRRWDAGLVQPFVPARLGDRVWEDKNGNGIQDCTDTNVNGILGDAGDTGPECNTGVPNVTVNLTDCAGNILDTKFTDGSGFYLFDNLDAGNYCVTFVKPTNFCSGVQFTAQDQGADNAKDSDANPADGKTAQVTLAPGETNRTVDAGIYCPARLGDRVWEDKNKNGVQDCTDTNGDGILGNAGDTGTECGNGVPNVPVHLTDCHGNTLANTSTNASGFYLFDNLAPGNYCVKFDKPTSLPNCAGTVQFTMRNQGSDDAKDSDANTSTGLSDETILTSGETDRTVDAGVYCEPGCDLRVNKTCEVVPPPPTSNWTCTKPLTSITMVSQFAQAVKIKAWKGAVGTLPVLANMVTVNPGAAVTVSGYSGTANDVQWEVFDAVTGTYLGKSDFHLSCSDPDMNDPTDCGKTEGDGKGLTGFLNKWTLEGIVNGTGQALVCTPTTTFPSSESCTATLQNPPSCVTMGKPKELVFEYTGAGCSATTNTQSGKATCSTIGTLNDPVAVKAGTAVGSSVYTVNPPSGINVGDTFKVTYGTTTLSTNSYFEIKDAQGDKQLLAIHTSCSQPLAVGDQFGSLKLVGFNGATGGVDVNYGYKVTNLGAPVTVTSMIDNKLGPVGSTPFPLGTGASAQFTETATVTGTTTNTVTVTANTGSGAQCTANDSLTVTMVPPPPPEWTSCAGKLKKFTLIWPANAGTINISGITNNAPGGVVNPGQTVVFSGPWSTNDLILNITGAVSGKSTFHVSCSDADMDGLTSTNLSQQQLPGKKQDCGKFAGNGKTTSATYINSWLLDGLIDANNQVLDCSP